MSKQTNDAAAARDKVAAIREDAVNLGWPEARLEALERILGDEDQIGEVCATHIEIVSKRCGRAIFYIDRETSLRMAGDGGRQS